MVLVDKANIRFDCESPILGKYGVTYLCSGQWVFVPWGNILYIELENGGKVRIHSSIGGCNAKEEEVKAKDR